MGRNVWGCRLHGSRHDLAQSPEESTYEYVNHPQDEEKNIPSPCASSETSFQLRFSLFLPSFQLRFALFLPSFLLRSVAFRPF